MLASVGQHGLLLFRERLVEGDGSRYLDGPVPGPGLSLEPAVVAPARDPQSRQGAFHRPAAASLGLLDFLVDALLQFERELAVVL
jgi:hypothetical protein